MSIKKDILFRINVVFLLLCSMATLIAAQAFRIQYFEGSKWRELGQRTTKIDTIEGDRGKIYSEDGRLIATSIPSFELRMDATLAPDSVFRRDIDSLCIALSTHFQDLAPEEYKQRLLEARRRRNAYVLLQREADYRDLQAVKQFPILNQGKFKGGLIVRASNKRVQPFNLLAQRTIGYARANAQSIGLEGAFNGQLRGAPVVRSMQLLAGGDWVSLSDDFETGLYNGKDVYTTIDVNLQDVVENALYRTVQQHRADYGCAIVMEVKTGKIKAIANLGRGTDSTYWEKYNYAIGVKSEMGSTFKVASLAALLDDGFVTDTTLINIGRGSHKFHDKWMHDSYPAAKSIISMARVMEISSNVGLAKTVEQYYGKQPSRFIKKLEQFHLSEPTGIEIEGEPVPTIKRPNTPDWSGITLPWMSIGYELELTPLQLLTFFNMIANDGRLMKPYLVTDIKEFNRTVQHFDPLVLEEQACQPETAQTIRRILKGVLTEGTARALYSDNFSIAGKTGTAKIAKNKKGYKEMYKASIAGFLPAENPIYSCIVVIHSPTIGGYYGADVAGPAFKEIVEKCYSIGVQYHEPINKEPLDTARLSTPLTYRGFQEDVLAIYKNLGIPAQSAQAEWVAAKKVDDTIALQPIRVVPNLVPNVIGMGLRDAVYLLENQGLKVRFSGRGKVKKQVPIYGQRFQKGDVVNIELE